MEPLTAMISTHTRSVGLVHLGSYCLHVASVGREAVPAAERSYSANRMSNNRTCDYARRKASVSRDRRKQRGSAGVDHSALGYSPIAECDFRLWQRSRKLSDSPGSMGERLQEKPTEARI